MSPEAWLVGEQGSLFSEEGSSPTVFKGGVWMEKTGGSKAVRLHRTWPQSSECPPAPSLSHTPVTTDTLSPRTPCHHQWAILPQLRPVPERPLRFLTLSLWLVSGSSLSSISLYICFSIFTVQTHEADIQQYVYTLELRQKSFIIQNYFSLKVSQP